MALIKTLVVLACAIAVASAVKHYHGYQVLRTTPTTQKHLEILNALENEGFDMWQLTKVLGMHADIMVPSEKKFKIEALFKDIGLDYSVMIQDVESVIGEERSRLASRRQSGNMTWDEYHTLDSINMWLDEIVALHSDLVSIETFGQSTEGREMRVLKFSTGGSGKQGFWIDATIHAREWISTAVSTYIINQLVTNRESYADILDRVDFYILPMVNPDGYEFTFTDNRLWRKTRSNPDNNTGVCIGVDANRNFGFMYGGDDGSSGNPCSETYRGANAYSEPETAAVEKYITERSAAVNWTTFVTLHSYSQLWMSPYGYSETELPEDYPLLKAVSDACVTALTRVHGTPYLTGAASQILYPSTGTSRDWAKGAGGFKFVYTIELRDEGRYGFVLPPEQIIPTAEETWAGIQVLARYL